MLPKNVQHTPFLNVADSDIAVGDKISLKGRTKFARIFFLFPE